MAKIKKNVENKLSRTNYILKFRIKIIYIKIYKRSSSFHSLFFSPTLKLHNAINYNPQSELFTP